MSAEGWPEPNGPVEAAARDLAAALGAQMLPQPCAQLVGGPCDGDMIDNRDGLFETPGPPPAFKAFDPSDSSDPITVTRYVYAPKSERPFFDSEVVTRFELVAPC